MKAKIFHKLEFPSKLKKKSETPQLIEGKKFMTGKIKRTTYFNPKLNNLQNFQAIFEICLS